jgi:MoaA/NifB/PqqE/SkfB family radical SAM enzyme
MHPALRHLGALFSRSRPVHLTLFLTRRCNARCPFCFYGKQRDAEGGPPELSLDEIGRVARSLDDLFWVAFSGGEPFLREDLAEIGQLLHDQNRVGFFTLPTNGLLPERIVARTEAILGRCPDSVVVVKLSLDGVGEDHDALRQVPGGFRQVIQAYRGLAGLARRFPRLEVGFNTLFCSDNQGKMEGIVDFVRGLDGARSHTITMVRGQFGEDRHREVDLARYQQSVRYLESRWGSGPGRFHRFAGSRLKAAHDRLQHRLIHRTLSQRRRLIPCYAGRLNLVLTESGELHPCEERWDRSFGNVRDAGYDVAAMLRSERAGRIRAETDRGGCYCSHECNFLVNILFNPRMHPALLGEYARLRLGLPARDAGGGGKATAEGRTGTQPLAMAHTQVRRWIA